jgi:hypothetical protein
MTMGNAPNVVRGKEDRVPDRSSEKVTLGCAERGCAGLGRPWPGDATQSNPRALTGIDEKAEEPRG